MEGEPMRIKSAKTVLLRIFFLLLTVFLFSVGTVNAQTCDPNPACDPTSGTCCANQCDPNPACVANDPNAMPCCNAGPEHGGPGPNNHGDSCMNMSPGPAQDACFKDKDDHHGGPNDHHNGPGDHGPGPNNHMGDPGCDPNLAPDAGGCPDGFQGKPHHDGPNDHGDQDAAHCRAMGMADGSPHVDPPQDVLDQVQAEYEANCKSGNCFLGEGNYKLLEGMGHTRAKVDCFLAEGHRKHDGQHGGPGDGNHPPAP